MTISEAVERLHQALRLQFRALTPQERGRLVRQTSVAQTHFYAWLRGGDHTLSTAKLSELMDAVRLSIEVEIRVTTKRRGRA